MADLWFFRRRRRLAPVGLLFESEAGIRMLHIPYKGTGPGVTDLLAGRIDMMFAPGPVVQPFVQAGQLKASGLPTRPFAILAGGAHNRRKRAARL